ncbi:MAG: hypothetical protein PHH82_00810 [Candidatus ainarchaeum sp.]|nr:hypothetical protein [Candidatus ainarchaeum sp.]
MGELSPFLKKVDRINSRIMPLVLVLLIFVIFYSIFGNTKLPGMQLVFEIIDILVIVVFGTDLIIIYKRSKNVRFFFTHHWLDILAVFPFGLIFGAINRTYLIFAETEKILVGQAIVHEAIKGDKMVKFLSKFDAIPKMIKAISTNLRKFTKSRLFQKYYATFYPNDERYNVADRMKKDKGHNAL